jgi:hypothetical protein
MPMQPLAQAGVPAVSGTKIMPVFESAATEWGVHQGGWGRRRGRAAAGDAWAACAVAEEGGMMQLRCRCTNVLLLGLVIAAGTAGATEDRATSKNPLAAQPLDLLSDTRNRHREPITHERTGAKP